MTKQIYIIGGGSCGLACGAKLSQLISNNQLDAKITILEKKDKVGKKLLATGNGRCNMSNQDLAISHYVGHHVQALDTLINEFDIQAFFEEFGLWSKYMGNLLYPQSEQAISVQQCLLNTLEQNKVDILLECSVEAIRKDGKQYLIETNLGTYRADYLILTTGSDAASQFGSDGSGMKLLKRLNHHIYPTYPSLVQLICKKVDKSLKGVRLHGTFTLYVDGVAKHQEKGEILFTDYGLSGISILQLSRYYQEYKEHKIEIGIDALDNYSNDELRLKLQNQLQLHGRVLLNGIIHQKYANYLEKFGLKEYSYKDLNTIVLLLKDYRFEIVDTNGKTNAQVCIGGADLSEFKIDSFESRLHPYLYAGGEVLDVAGDCGGYNLHFAFASANGIAKGVYISLLMEVSSC